MTQQNQCIGGLMAGVLLFILAAPHISHASTSVRINEIAWMGTQVGTENHYLCEWIELHNTTNGEIDVAGWTLYEQNGGTPIISLGGTIPAGGYYLIERVTNSCPDAVPALNADDSGTFGGGGLSNAGEHLTLVNESGEIIDQLNDSNGWSAGNNDTKQTAERLDAGDWQTSSDSGGTPRAKNSSTSPPPQEEPHEEPDPESEPTPPSPPPPDPKPNPEPQPETSVPSTPQPPTYPHGIIINELLPSPDGSDAETEWIEVHNTTNETVVLSFWTIEDTTGSTHIFTFLRGSMINANGYLVLSRPTTGITLNNDADGVILRHPDGAETSQTSYTGAMTGFSHALFEGTWHWTPTPTPGSVNIAPPVEAQDVQTEEQPTNAAPFSAPPTKTKSPAATDSSIPKPETTAAIANGQHPSSSPTLIVGGLLALAALAGIAAWKMNADTISIDNDAEEY